MLNDLANNSQLFFLIFVRVFALVRIAPLFSSQSVPSVVRASFAVLIAFVILPYAQQNWYQISDNGLQYGLLVIGEALIGLITGYILALIITVFQVIGQFFSLQMGFAVAQIFDPVSQVQIPLMGQFINIMAMFIFLSVNGLQRIILTGVLGSFQNVHAIDLVVLREPIVRIVLVRLSRLFEHALIMSFPIIGILFLVYVGIGLISKAAPQMNLLLVGFPFAIGVAFFILLLILPFLADIFQSIFDDAFEIIIRLFRGNVTTDGPLGIFEASQ